MKFDIIILSHNKDHNKLPFLINSIKKNIFGYSNIHIISPTEVSTKIDGINYHLDENALPLKNETKSKIKEWYDSKVFTRQKINWILQQYIKLFNIVTDNDYLIIDSDIIINNQITIFENGKPNFLLGRNQYQFEYFDFNKKILSIDRKYNWSFISEIMFFKKNIISKILENFDNDYNSFITHSLKYINNSCFISEFELYGNFVMTYFPADYNFKNLKSHLEGKHTTWNDSEIQKKIEQFQNTDFNIFSIHTWN